MRKERKRMKQERKRRLAIAYLALVVAACMVAILWGIWVSGGLRGVLSTVAACAFAASIAWAALNSFA